jgi:riboflavin synthase
MFTGIVEELGRVRSLDGGRLAVDCSTVSGDAEIGASISVSGVCLTVVDRDDGALAFDLAEETLRRTTLGGLTQDDPVNLERPVTLLTRLGGHLVQGHVDGVGIVAELEPAGPGAEMTITMPDGLGRHVVEKGSVAVDGVSLTVSSAEGDRFRVALIPHTLSATTLGGRRPGDRVNLETDVVAKYVEGLLRREP